jgi:hypothetical protein
MEIYMLSGCIIMYFRINYKLIFVFITKYKKGEYMLGGY